jgi:mannan endo-1,4-beta-mannosidase
MKGTLLQVFSAMIVVVLVISIVLTDGYAQRQLTEDAKEESLKLTAMEVVDKTQQQEEKRKKEQEAAELAGERATYTLFPTDQNTNLFYNKVDGYMIQVPKGMEAHMSFSNIRAVLKNKDLTIEVYRQETGTASGASIESYVNYSNQFIENRIDHYKEMEGKEKINGRKVSFLQWSRRSLSKIENDKCHYASVEVILSDREVLTFFFKSNLKFTRMSYMDVIRTLKLAEKTVQPYERKIRQVENPSWNEATKAAYDQYFGPNSRLHWGIFETDAPVNFTELKKIEQELDFKFPILLYYTGILEDKEMHPDLAVALANAKQEGRMLELTLQTVAQTHGKGNMVYDILDGKYDTYLQNYANAVADYGEPILFRLGNEMNGDWCVYSSHHTSKDTEIFKAFYRYIYKIFQEAGADNVIWVWNPNGKAFPDFKWNDELCYYPGDEYVDVIGMTSYNTGTYYQNENWTEFDQMYDPLYQKYTERYDKPLMITEFSSSSFGGDKEAWVSRMFQHIGKYDRIKVAVWWDGCDWDADKNIARSYFIDETEDLVKIFRENLAN